MFGFFVAPYNEKEMKSSMNNDSAKSDFLFAKAKTAITLMNATGWSHGSINPENLSGDAVFFYAYEPDLQWTWCCAIQKDTFYTFVNEFKDVDPSVFASLCAHMIDLCSKHPPSPDHEMKLAQALSCYIAITNTYAISDKARRQNHFAVIRYGKTELVRPFALGGPARALLPASQIKQAFHSVVTMDLDNHPEWFGKDKPAPTQSSNG